MQGKYTLAEPENPRPERTPGYWRGVDEGASMPKVPKWTNRTIDVPIFEALFYSGHFQPGF